MRVLYVNKVSPRLGGGAEVRLLEIGQRLVKRGHSIHVVCSKTEPRLPNYENINGIEVHYLNLLPDSVFHLKRFSFYLSRYLFYPATIRIAGLIKRIAPDIIVDYVAPSPSLVYLLAKQLGLPCCAEVMGFRDQKWSDVGGLITESLGKVSDIALRKVQYDKVIAVSNFLRCKLEEISVPPEHIVVIPNGVNRGKYQDNDCSERNRRVLVVMARLVPGKGHKHLFDALVDVRLHFPDVYLYVVGDGPLRSALERYVQQKGIAQNVVFTGQVRDEKEKVSLWRRSSIFVMPSLQEGFGLVMLEAMAAGLPIVAFDLPVYQEFMNSQCGFFVPVGDAQSMAARIVGLLQDDESRSRISVHNLAHVRQFEWDRIVVAYEQALSDTLHAGAVPVRETMAI